MTVGSARRPVKGMVSYEYKLDKPRALIEKLRRDLDRLRRDSTDSSDHAYNFAVTAWHLTDWVWRFDEILRPEAKTRFGWESLSAFQAGIRLASRPLDICGDMANGSKHLILGKESQPVVAPVSDRQPNAAVRADGLRRQGATLVGSDGRRVLIGDTLNVALPGGAVERAEELFESALEFWVDFFKTCGLLPAGSKKRLRVPNFRIS